MPNNNDRDEVGMKRSPDPEARVAAKEPKGAVVMISAERQAELREAHQLLSSYAMAC
jgi:hypothetical protein